MTNKPMKITHALKEDQQFTVSDLEVGEVFTLGATLMIMGHKLLHTEAYSCWDLQNSAAIRVPAEEVVKQRVNAELILS